MNQGICSDVFPNTEKRQHFKLEDRRTVVKLVTPYCFMATLDLKNAYYLVSIANADHKFLRFCFNNQLYEFTCLPFGLNTTAYTFTKILKPVVAYLRFKGSL